MTPITLLRSAARAGTENARSIATASRVRFAAWIHAGTPRATGGMLGGWATALLALAAVPVLGCGSGGDSPNDICLAACQANSVFHSQYKQCVADNCLLYVPPTPVWDRTTVVWAIDEDTGEVSAPAVIYGLRNLSLDEMFIPALDESPGEDITPPAQPSDAGALLAGN